MDTSQTPSTANNPTHTATVRTNSDSRRKALIVGAGIAGLSAASALDGAGWQSEIVERSPERRRGGYFIMMFGSGRTAADHLGIRGLRPRNANDATSYSFDRHGNKKGSMGFSDFPTSPWMMLRGDVEQAAFESLPTDVEITFSTTPTAITQDEDGATVTLRNTSEGTERTERYDLVVGADGIRSTTRKLVWGPHSDYLNKLGYMICAYELPEPLPGLRIQDGANLSEPGRSFMVFNFEDHAPTVLFSYKPEDPVADRARAKEIGVPAHLREVYGPEPLGDMMEAALDHLEHADEFLFDSVEQTRVDHWHHGHVMLLGDAAWCPTLYSGMGATSSLSGADVLRVALQEHPDSLERALTAWEEKLRGPIDEFQKAAFPMRSIFVQDNAEEVRKQNRNGLQKFLFTFPPAAKIVANLPSLRLRNSDLAA